ncbi:MAG TPA: hypothetical protein ENH00_13210 [Actinobacteria bacterium]|nr:hypothetical protein [Actinomycetota bacterium]
MKIGRLAVLFVVVTGLLVPGPQVAGQVKNPVLSWVSTGDSYSSGEGVYGNEGPCAKSDNAYGPAAVRLLENRGWTVEPYAFTACTGSLVEDQFVYGGKSGRSSLWNRGGEQGVPDRVDVITMSFGGNDIGFADIVKDCLFLPSSFRSAVGTLELNYQSTNCSTPLLELEMRIDHLLNPPLTGCVGGRGDTHTVEGEDKYACDLIIDENDLWTTDQGRYVRGSITDFYRYIADNHVTDRGQLFVVGYPALFAPVDEWPAWNRGGCKGMLPADAKELNAAARFFDSTLRRAVKQADQGEGRIRYISLYDLYREGRHGLCGAGDDWLNGITIHRGSGNELRKEGSFHPDQAGHAAVAERIADMVETTDWATTVTPTIVLSQGETASAGYWYSVDLSGYEPGSTVTVQCHDSTETGFWSQTLTIDTEGKAADSTLCYSGDGPDHWVTGGGVESNHITWGPTTTSICTELATADEPYASAVGRWLAEGRPATMDPEANGIPCDTAYPLEDIDAFLNAVGSVDSGEFCSDLYSWGVPFSVAVGYWLREGMPDRMDADLDGIPCETVYPTEEIDAFLSGTAYDASPTTTVPASPQIVLAQGGPASAGYWYSVVLSAFEPGSTVTVECHDSVDTGFWSQSLTIGADGTASDATLCYSGDGPDHWVTGGGVESNHITWGSTTTTSTVPTTIPSSPDAETLSWTRVADSAGALGGPGNEAMAEVARFGSGLVAVGYDSSGGDLDAAVWVSPDGTSWSRAADPDGVFGGGGDQQMWSVAGFGSGLVGVGYDSSGGDWDAAVWISPDGVAWSRVADPGGVFGGSRDQVITSVVAFGSGLVGVGYDSSGGDWDAAVWVSPDGVAWSRVADPEGALGGGGDQQMRDVVGFGTGLVAVGNDAGILKPAAGVWLSSDGLSWVRADDPRWTLVGPFGKWMTSVVQFEGGLVAAGSERAGWDWNGAVWESPDGQLWKYSTTVSRGSGDQIVWDLVKLGSGLVAVGTDDAGDDVDGAVWVSMDGASWSGVADPMAALGGIGHQEIRSVVGFGSGLVAVGSDSGNAAVWIAGVTP